MTKYTVLYILLGLYLVMSACRKDNFLTDPTAMLEFSTDTLRFDTVFTTKGSATRILKVYNRHSQPVMISSIRLLQGNNATFRLNVDGIAGNDQSDIQIAADDSLYIFAEVTIDPDQPLSVSPYVIENQIVFILNGNEQKVLVQAWGQNANYIPNSNAQGQQSLLSCNLNQVIWDDPRPYVIYGVVFIDSCTLVIPAGTKLYFHGGIARPDPEVIYNDGILFTLPAGKIRMEGTIESPVLIQGDRLEPEFKDVPGQWSGIRLGKDSKGPHVFNNVIIRNPIVGIYADSASHMILDRVQVYNSSSAGIAGVRARIDATNCLFANCFGGGAALVYGGNYNFTYCTFANIGIVKEGISAQNFICYDPPVCSVGDIFPITLNVTNSIFQGAGRDVVSMADARPEQSDFFRYQFSHTLVRVEELLKNPRFADFNERCINCIPVSRTDTLFLNASMKDYSLDTMSLARGKAMFLNNILTDIKGNSRKPVPDAGCYEFVE